MATIQVRDVPEDVHRTFRRRAAEAGMSLQELLLGELTRAARRRTPAEVMAEVERRMADEGADGYATVSAADIVGRDRASH
jgi:plasmid stability protein